MKSQEVKQLSDKELLLELHNHRRHLFDLRSQAVTEKLENPSLIRMAKRDIARMLTEIRRRELEARENLAGQPLEQENKP